MEMKGKISISRPSGPEEPYVSINIMDEEAWTELTEVRIDLEDFARLMTGQSMIACRLLIGDENLSRIGTTREHKTEFVPGESMYGDDEYRKKMIEPFEVNGWRGYYQDFGNGHRSMTVNGVRGYRVRFIRHVEKT